MDHLLVRIFPVDQDGRHSYTTPTGELIEYTTENYTNQGGDRVFLTRNWGNTKFRLDVTLGNKEEYDWRRLAWYETSDRAGYNHLMVDNALNDMYMLAGTDRGSVHPGVIPVMFEDVDSFMAGDQNYCFTEDWPGLPFHAEEGRRLVFYLLVEVGRKTEEEDMVRIAERKLCHCEQIIEKVGGEWVTTFTVHKENVPLVAPSQDVNVAVRQVYVPREGTDREEVREGKEKLWDLEGKHRHLPEWMGFFYMEEGHVVGLRSQAGWTGEQGGEDKAKETFLNNFKDDSDILEY